MSPLVVSNGERESERIRHIEAKCEACGGKLRVRVGRKSTARRVRCVCGAVYDYSCWNLRVLPNGAGHVDKFEAFRVLAREYCPAVSPNGVKCRSLKNHEGVHVGVTKADDSVWWEP